MPIFRFGVSGGVSGGPIVKASLSGSVRGHSARALHGESRPRQSPWPKIYCNYSVFKEVYLLPCLLIGISVNLIQYNTVISVNQSCF